MKTPEHILQLSLFTQKTYPGYWEMQSSVSYINGYSEIWGHTRIAPTDKLQCECQLRSEAEVCFRRILLPTQRPVHANGLSVHRTVGHDLQDDELELHAVRRSHGHGAVPDRNVVGFRWVAVEQYARHRCDDFFDLPFDRKKWILQCQWDNTFKLNKNLTFELRGFMQTPAIQGTYDLKMVGTVDAGVKWTFAGDKATLSARCSDIFNTSMPECNLRYGGQDVRMENSFYLRTLTLNFSFRFGGYKKKGNQGSGYFPVQALNVRPFCMFFRISDEPLHTPSSKHKINRLRMKNRLPQNGKSFSAD